MIKSKNIILGVDPGLNKTGWGVIENFNSFDKHIDHGVIFTEKKVDLGSRLNTIYEKLTMVVKKYCPKYLAVEKIFSNMNPDSTLKLGKARGIIFLVASQNGLKINEYSPNTVKKNLVGYGHADKNQIIKMLCRIYPNLNIDSEDAADALAVAICHSMQKKSKLNSMV